MALLGIVAAGAMVAHVSVSAAKKIYSGTLYIAGMGGHFAKADVTIDPSDEKQPIKDVATSVCLDCHQQMQFYTHALLCGIDANWKR